MLLFVFWGAASYFWSIEPASTLYSLQTYMLLLVLYFLIVNVVRGEKQFSPAMIALWVGMLVLVISGLLGVSSIRLNDEDSRLAGIAGNPNTYVAILVALVPPSYWVYSRTRVPFRKVLVPAAVLAAGITSFYAKSRGGFISIGVFFLCLLAFRQTRRRALGFVVLFLVLALRLAPLGLWQRIDESRQRGNVRTATLWPAGLRAFGGRPLLGSGLGTNQQAISLVRGGGGAVTHNSPLAVAIELGAVGVTLYLAMMTYCTARLWRAIASAEQQGRSGEALFAVVLLAGFFGYMTNWFKSGGMEYAKMVWVLIGLMSAYARILEQPPEAAPAASGRPLSPAAKARF